MSKTDPEWLAASRGTRPTVRWSFATDAPLVGLELARETGEVLAADASGGLYLLDRRGQVVSLSRGFHALGALAWSDVGTGGALVMGETRLCRLNRQLKVDWSLDLPDVIRTIAVDPFGQYVAVCLAGGGNVVFDPHKRQVGAFDTMRPLSFVQFLSSEPTLIGAADYGLLTCHDLQGRELWSERPWSNVGDLGVTGSGDSISLAGFNQGIQKFDGSGHSLGSHVVEGTASRLSTSFIPRRLIVATIERHLHWLDGDGELLWAAQLPEEIIRVRCAPLGTAAVCGLTTGRILRLDWE